MRAHFCRILNRYAKRANGPISEILCGRMFNIIVIMSVGSLTLDARCRVDRKKIETYRAEIAFRVRISVEF